MVSIIGNVMQALALVFALVSAVLLLAGVQLDGARKDRAVRTGYAFTYVSFGLLTACIGVILVCMLTENYSLAYVVSNYPATDSPLQPLYRVSAVWAGRQGSLLLWTWLIAAFGAAQAHARRRARMTLHAPPSA